MFDAESNELLNLGRQHSLRRNYPEALKSFEQALHGSTFAGGLILAPQFLSHYGAALASTGRMEEGHRFCERSIQLEPYEPEHYLNLGLVRWMSGEAREAFQAFDQGLSLYPDHPGLISEKRRLERRGARFFPSLHRNHLLNHFLGKLFAASKHRDRS